MLMDMNRTVLTILLMSLWSSAALGYQPLTASDSGALVHWRTPVVGLEVDYTRSPFSAAELDTLIQSASREWQDTPCPPPVLAITDEAESSAFGVDGINRLLWLDIGWPGTSAELALTLVTRDSTTGEIVDADILMNLEDHVFTANAVDNDLLVPAGGVLNHEVGHLYGLDHSEDGSALMFGNVLSGILNSDFTADDRGGTCALYARRSSVDVEPVESEGAFIAPYSSPDDHPTGPFGMGVVVLLLGVFFLTKLKHQPLVLMSLFLALSCDGDPSRGGERQDAGLSNEGDSEEEDLERPVRIDDAEADTANMDEVPWTTVPPDRLGSSTFVVEVWNIQQDLIDPSEDATEVIVEPRDIKTRYHFHEDGRLERTDGLEPSDVCKNVGRWSLEDESTLALNFANPAGCSDLPELTERYVLKGKPDGALRLDFIDANWRYAGTLTSMRTHSMLGRLEDSQDREPCPEPRAKECTYNCGIEGMLAFECGGDVENIGCARNGQVWSCAGPCLAFDCTADAWETCIAQATSEACAPSDY